MEEGSGNFRYAGGNRKSSFLIASEMIYSRGPVAVDSFP